MKYFTILLVLLMTPCFSAPESLFDQTVNLTGKAFGFGATLDNRAFREALQKAWTGHPREEVRKFLDIVVSRQAPLLSMRSGSSSSDLIMFWLPSDTDITAYGVLFIYDQEARTIRVSTSINIYPPNSLKPNPPNQTLQHNDPSYHVSCLRTPRASRGRG